MKDQLALLYTGIIGSIGAWTFWHFAGAEGMHIIGLVAVVALAVDNRRLRRKLRQQPSTMNEN